MRLRWLAVGALLLAASALVAAAALRWDERDRAERSEHGDGRRLVFDRGGVSVLETARGFELTNEHGIWLVQKRCGGPGGSTVGPGYVHAAGTLPSGSDLGATTLVSDGLGRGPLNDPRFGGLGAFAWHHARGRPGRTRFGARNAWEVSVRDCARDNDGFGVSGARVVRRPSRDEAVARLVLDVDLSDRFTYPRPIARVRYAYEIRRAEVAARITVTALCHHGRCGRTPLVAFVKEPKVVASVRGVYRAAIFDDEGRFVCQYRNPGPPSGPLLDTGQCAADRRAVVRFDHGEAGADADGGCARGPCLEVEARADDGPWEGAGFDGWALAAAERPAAGPRDTASIDGVIWDCHDPSPAAHVHRRWETAARLQPPRGTPRTGAAVSVLFHAWEGGRGGYDCEPLARQFGPYGESYTVRLTFRIV
jgi:hypothetical protein